MSCVMSLSTSIEGVGSESNTDYRYLRRATASISSPCALCTRNTKVNRMCMQTVYCLKINKTNVYLLVSTAFEQPISRLMASWLFDACKIKIVASIDLRAIWSMFGDKTLCLFERQRQSNGFNHSIQPKKKIMLTTKSRRRNSKCCDRVCGDLFLVIFPSSSSFSHFLSPRLSACNSFDRISIIIYVWRWPDMWMSMYI